MNSDDTAKFLQLQAAFEEGACSRAALQTFMVDNHDRLAAMFGNSRINWINLTAAFNRIGFRTPKGEELNKDVVRVTWDRAKKLHLEKASKKSRRVPVSVDPPANKPDQFLIPAPKLAPPTVKDIVQPVIKPGSTEMESPPSSDDAWGSLETELNKRSGRT